MSSRRATPSGALGAIAVVVGLLVGLVACGSSPHRAPTGHQARPNASMSAPPPPIVLSADYRSMVMTSVAASLKLSSTQITTELAADPTSTLMTIAKPLGVAQDALSAKLRTALASATAAQLSSARWTPRQAAGVGAYWAAQSDPVVISEVSRWFRGG